jgi:surface antigen
MHRRLRFRPISAIDLWGSAASESKAGGAGEGARMRVAIMTAALGAVLLGGCGGGSEIVTGAIPPGANTGRVIGSPVATGAGEPTVGPVEGGLTGADVGRSLSEADRAIALKAEYEALEYGRAGLPTEWRGSSGAVTGRISVGAGTRVNSLDCRAYTHNISIGGRMRVVSGTACRRPDGVWRILG